MKNSNIDYIKEMMDVFHNSTGLDCVLFDESGIEICAKKDRYGYCEYYQEIANCYHACTTEHLESMEQSAKLGEAYISYCSAGAVYYTVSVDNNEFKGMILGGPVHMSEPDIALAEMIAANNSLNEENTQKLIKLYKNIHIVSPSTARYQLKLLNILASDINSYTKENQKKKKEILGEQRNISENLKEIKFLESMAASKLGYPIHLEMELSECIIKGNEDEAKAILNEILGYIFFKHSGDNRKIISMSIELTVVMSRAAIQGGAMYEDVSKLNGKIFEIALDTTNIEEICLWLTKIVEKMILLVFPINTGKDKQKSILRKAIIYINRNIQGNVTLEEAADHVGLSPTYFSKLFAKEMQINFVDYLNIIRIKESKKFLADRDMSLGDIAVRLGFNDQSYFTKVFKKYEGMTPGKYRNQKL